MDKMITDGNTRLTAATAAAADKFVGGEEAEAEEGEGEAGEEEETEGGEEKVE